MSPVCQVNSPQSEIANSSSTKAVSFSSACTTKRFPSSRCASAIEIVHPLESIDETQLNCALSLFALLQFPFDPRVGNQPKKRDKHIESAGDP